MEYHGMYYIGKLKLEAGKYILLDRDSIEPAYFENLSNNLTNKYLSNSGGIINGKLDIDGILQYHNQDIDDRYINADGDTVSRQLVVNYNQDVSSSTTGALIVKTAGDSLNIDGNEIQAYDGTSISELHLQNEGGEVRIGGNNSSDLIVNGDISTDSISLIGDSDWTVGTIDQVADIIIKNPNAAIKSDNGNLKLDAGASNITLNSFVQFSPQQYGQATIQAGTTEILIGGKNVTANSVIILTPCADVSPYVEITPPNFSIKISPETTSDSVINYLILSK